MRLEALDFPLANLAGGFSKTFYYDASPKKKERETECQFGSRRSAWERHSQYLRQVDGVHVYEGDLRQGEDMRWRQKKVDVLIAVDMLSHTFSRNMDWAVLLASDLDFEPVLTALVQRGMNVELLYPPSNTSVELPRAADRRTPLLLRNFWGAIEPLCRWSPPAVVEYSARPDAVAVDGATSSGPVLSFVSQGPGGKPYTYIGAPINPQQDWFRYVGHEFDWVARVLATDEFKIQFDR